MYTFTLADPATPSTLANARRDLENTQQTAKKLSEQIQDAEARLARIVHESRCAIQQLEAEKAVMEKRIAHTLAYLSPIRRLPHELLQHIFLFNFEDYPCCAWVLSSVCSLWRRITLSMPKLWSKIRLVTSSEAPADTVRLWLERSGNSIPLDIEIFLHSPPSIPSTITRSSRSTRRTLSNTLMLSDEHWVPAITTPPPPGVAIPITPFVSVHTSGALVPMNTGGQNEPLVSTLWPQGLAERARDSTAQPLKSRSSMHWGYIAFFYLIEQMHRWERFVFRFDKQFPSMAALKSIAGDAPLLREFEISSAEGLTTGLSLDWPWLPCTKPDSPVQLQALRSVTLQHVPFKWSTPMLHNLQHLNLRSIPSVYINTDRILHIISNCPALESLSLYFSSVHSAVLPLNPRTLPDLKTLTIGGHYNLVAVLDTLILPSLDSITIDIDTRDPIEDTLLSLLQRSGDPQLTYLSLSYTSPNTGAGLYYGAGSSIASWGFLRSIDSLQTLQVGGTPFESLLTTLGAPDEDEGWICPNLTKLGMRACHAHTNGAAKLVRLIDVRNPEHGGTGGIALPPQYGGTPAKLRHLEVHDCVVLGPDVVEWLKGRIEKVICTEPMYDSFNSPRSPPYHDPYM